MKRTPASTVSGGKRCSIGGVDATVVQLGRAVVVFGRLSDVTFVNFAAFSSRTRAEKVNVPRFSVYGNQLYVMVRVLTNIQNSGIDKKKSSLPF